MEHFTNRISDENEDMTFLSHDPATTDNDLDSSTKDIDIEALLNRPRYPFRRSRPLYEAPEFVQRLEAFIEEDEGSTIVFQCRWKSFPKPNIKWFKDDEEITEDHPYYLIQADDKSGILRLTLHDITQQDEGAYKCKAENQEGVASTTGYLSVKANPADKTLSAQQKSKTNSNSKQNSPSVSLAPHLQTILEQKSLEEREAEAQRKLPPSPLQDYIETVQKTKTWPLAKMGYNPEDFIRNLYPQNGISAADDNDDAKSSDSDTSVDSQPDELDPLNIKLPSRDIQPSDLNLSKRNITLQCNNKGGGDKINITNGLIPKVNSLDDESGSESDDDIESGPPVCTVSVQMRSEDSVSRLTKIRQDEKHRLSLTLSEGSAGSDSDEDSLSDETPVANEAEIEPKVTSTVQVQHQIEEGFKRMVTLQDKSQKETAVNDKPTQSANKNSITRSLKENPCLKDNSNVQETGFIAQVSNEISIKKLPKQSPHKALIQQKSREGKDRLKKQKSLVEVSIEWLFQKITGKVGEQLDLPWIYYFAFTVFGACLAAALRLNPFYLIISVAILSFVSFRFLPCNDEVLAGDSFENNEVESNVENDV